MLSGFISVSCHGGRQSIYILLNSDRSDVLKLKILKINHAFLSNIKTALTRLLEVLRSVFFKTWIQATEEDKGKQNFPSKLK